MSTFDDNPFADPAIEDPFADPSVQQVARNTTNTQRGLDDYNPFSQQGRPEQNAPRQQESQPAIMQAVSPPPTRTAPPTNQPPPNFTTEDFERRQRELEQKAAELARREAELLATGPSATGHENNWPPLPSFLPFGPCFYHDINVDIQLQFHNIMRQLYYLWMFYVLVLTLNIIGALAILIGTGAGTTFILSFVYFGLMVPLSFICWYRPIYKAFKDDSSLNFIIFFFMFIFQTILTSLQALGILDTCGLMTSIPLFKTNIGVGIVTFIVALGFCVAAVGDVLLLIKVHRIYRSNDLTLLQAKDELTTNFMQNRHVRGAAANVATAAVQSQFSNPNRY